MLLEHVLASAQRLFLHSLGNHARTCAAERVVAQAALATASWTDLLPASWAGKVRHRHRHKYPAAPLQPYDVTPVRPVEGVGKPAYVRNPLDRIPAIGKQREVHNAKGIQRMRAAGRIAAAALQHAGSLVAPGITTDAIDAATHDFIISQKAYPSPLLYGGYPKSICASVNECAIHGVPNLRPLQEGDIVTIDVTVYKDHYHADINATFYVGQPKPHAQELVAATREALDAAIARCGPGVRFREIGAAVQDVADREGMSIVKEYVGHGIGRVFHAAPAVHHFRNDKRGVMQRGQTFTIEPILTLGSRRLRCWDDGWTLVTKDGSLAAQFEVTLLVDEHGVEVLTPLQRLGDAGIAAGACTGNTGCTDNTSATQQAMG